MKKNKKISLKSKRPGCCGIGIDIVSIKRFNNLSKKDFDSWRKVFTKEEWKYSFNSAEPPRHLAAIFASKEAVMKAVCGEIVKRYDLIEVAHKLDGEPTIRFKKDVKRNISISISHDGGFVIAVALALDC